MTVEHVTGGSGAPTEAPPSIGAHYTNTANGDQYLASGTASAEDWKLLARAAQLPAAAQLIPAGGTPGQMLTPASGGARVWADPPSGGGGAFLTPNNFVARIQSGALGIWNQPFLFYADDIGGLVQVNDSDILRPAPWLDDTVISWASFGCLQVSASSGAGCVADGNADSREFWLTTGSAADGQAQARTALPSGSLRADSGQLSVQLWLPAASNGTDSYNMEVYLNLPPYSAGFVYGADYGSNWSVSYDDNNGDEQLVDTGAAATGSAKELSMVIDGANMVFSVAGSTVLTVPLAEMDDGATEFGADLSLTKTDGSTPARVRLYSILGQAVPAPE
ncbi:hypothetical protein [Pseudomonas citronellolis]|uniref:hypothetical protein n=1 Tax=Pseudomonas citronellolis TaxID=53408 RepID=UPI0023E43357|nr:hypothetical protein [Pseudomonas citronellolis]MDF3932157.1 hypothetical protein [Pseudomonas citronellolis]